MKTPCSTQSQQKQTNFTT